MKMIEVLAVTGPGDRWGHMNDGVSSGWMWVGGSLMMLFWVAVIGLTVWFVLRTVGPREPGDREPGDRDGGIERARGILAERYARGELSTDEYEERSAKLG